MMIGSESSAAPGSTNSGCRNKLETHGGITRSFYGSFDIRLFSRDSKRSAPRASRARRMPHADAMVDVMTQHRIEVIARAHGLVVDRLPRAVSPHLVEEVPHGFEISLAQRTRIADQLARLFEPFEAGGAGIVEVELFVV